MIAYLGVDLYIVMVLLIMYYDRFNTGSKIYTF